MTICLFDWTPGGHHPTVMRRIAEALAPEMEVVLAAPDVTLADLADLGVRTVSLGAPRPLPLGADAGDPDSGLRLAGKAELAEAELDLVDRVVAEVAPDHLWHLYSDPVLRWLVRRPPLPVPVTLSIYNGRAHYPASYGSRLGPWELARARFQERLVARWRARRDAHALFVPDPGAVERWSSRPGAPVFFLPEPPVAAMPAPAPGEREGCILYGGLAPRKGLDRLARAVALGPTSLRVRVAGELPPGYTKEAETLFETMRRAGARVEPRFGRLDEAEGLRELGSARCAVLPYYRHISVSRVLAEAAAMGAPAVAHDFGFLAHEVRSHGLGLVVDCDDPRAVRQAILSLTEDPDAAERYASSLRSYVITPELFAARVQAPFGTGAAVRAGASRRKPVAARPREQPGGTTTVCLFDWTPGGHHPMIMRRIAEALAPEVEVVLAAPDETLAELADLGIQSVSLGAPRPIPLVADAGAPGLPDKAELAKSELDLIDRVVAEVAPDHLWHLYSDPVLRWLVRRPPLPVPVTLSIFHARAHYPAAYGSRLGPWELARARFQERLVARWRARRDAHALFVLDAEGARRWSRRPGAPVFELPEPPVAAMPAGAPAEREGCILYGGLAPNKGLDRLARAVALESNPLRVRVMCSVPPGYASTTEELLESMRAAGAQVESRLGPYEDAEGLRELGSARCVVLPYHHHLGGSRVLAEAAAMGTPAVAHDFGQLAHLVRTHELGLVVDCSDPRALREAILTFAEDPEAVARYAPGLSSYPVEAERFAALLQAPFVARSRRASERMAT